MPFSPVAALPLLITSMTVADATDGALETVAQFGLNRPGNVTVTEDDRVIVTMHPLDNPEIRVVEVLADGSKVPFPTEDWADGPEKGAVGIAAAIGIDSDSRGIVWIMDMGGPDTPTQMVGWDTRQERIHQVMRIGTDELVENSFLQDFAIDESRQRAYIADMTLGNFVGEAKPAIVVLDLETGKSRRVLEGTSSFMPEERSVHIDGLTLSTEREDGTVDNIYLGLNPIVIDANDEWVYYGTINGETIWRIPAAALSDPEKSRDELEALIEEYGPKKPSDGIAFAPGGGILITDIEGHAVGLTTPGQYEIVKRDASISWPDGFATTPDGWVYVVQNQLHRHPNFSAGRGNAMAPYRLLRFRFLR